MKRLRTRALLVGFAFGAASVSCAEILGARFDDATLDGGSARAADGGDGAIDGAALDPRSLPNLELWLAADFGIVEEGPDAGVPDAETDPMNGVALWEDRSGKAHPAIGIDPPRRPIVLRNGGSLPVIAFDRARRTCLVDRWSAAGLPLTLFVVSQGDATNVLRFESTGVPGWLGFPWNSNYAQGGEPELRLLLASSATAREMPRLGSRGSSWEVLSARLVAREVGGLRTYRNGKLSEQASVGQMELPPFDSLKIGCLGLVDEFATALVGEILVYAAALSDADRTNVEEYLRIKWRVAY